MPLDFYLEKFRNLNTNSRGGRNSPHKVCMLLSVMDLIQAGHIHSNKIQLNDVLKERFSFHFNERKQGNDQDKPETPFYHLQTEGFWGLAYNSNVDSEKVTRYSAKSISHAYLDDNLFEYFKSSIVSNDLKDALLENLSDLPTLYVQWMLDLGKSNNTIKKYLQAIQGSITNWLIEANVIQVPLTSVNSFSKFNLLAEQAKNLDKFKVIDARGHGMYKAALNSYLQFLKDLAQLDIKSDIQKIVQDNKLTATERSIMISARIGQGTFRRQLIDMWKGCAVTGYKNSQLLMASHIKPWHVSNNEERLDKYNGLLLLANLDKAFDLGFISFANTGEIILSKHLEKPQVLGLKDGMRFDVHKGHMKYLDHHRNELFKGY
ncbi:HNH endonuclease [Psychromonas sp. L1A2]|uniref:HNH endonuclease n=1 Tax=Psychromonas sp. L1A2 TaxID=2686356 RepID=UPI00135AD170|nr:HNH endonuclease [Psychromonas sp. L1A2]